MATQREQKLRALAKLMNRQNVSSIPVTKALIDCFDAVITPEENEFLIKLGTEPHTYQQATEKAQIPEEDFPPFFENILKKGLVWEKDCFDGDKRYELAPILLGWFEIYLSNGKETPQQQEFARRVEKLFQSWGNLNRFPIRYLWNLKHQHGEAHKHVATTKSSPTADSVTVKLNRQINANDTEIYPSKSVFELIEKYGNKNEIAVVHCFCRQWKKMVGDPCRFDYPPESCIVIGKFTKYTVDYGIGRYISKSDAFQLIKRLQKSGAVHQVYYEHEDMSLPEIAICNCCWDCCGVLGSYNRGILPLHFKSYYIAQIENAERCTKCRKCEKYCPVEAIFVEGQQLKIDEQKCIGCGQCELQCPHNVLSLRYLERDVILPLQKKSKARIKPNHIK